ncbi:MAG TPA: hypothetical protein PKD79_03385 [Candidatus Doudnabacteria bacterium]|nr:hypothetical protein [Candidatus Doudnabacteria bacterium]
MQNREYFLIGFGILGLLTIIVLLFIVNPKTRIIEKVENMEDGQKQNINNSTQENNLIFPEAGAPSLFRVGSDWVEINRNWSIRLDEVISDERCPYLLTCETSGWAKINFQLQQSNVDYYQAYMETFEVSGLNRWPMPDGEIKEALLRPRTIEKKDINNQSINFQLTVLDLRPYPVKQFFMEPSKLDYVALIKILESN